MSKVILDPDLRGKLNGLNEPIEVCEPTGRTVGHFVPEEMYLKLLYAIARDAVSKEELDAAAQETGGRTWADIRRGLGEKIATASRSALRGDPDQTRVQYVPGSSPR